MSRSLQKQPEKNSSHLLLPGRDFLVDVGADGFHGVLEFSLYSLSHGIARLLVLLRVYISSSLP